MWIGDGPALDLGSKDTIDSPRISIRLSSFSIIPFHSYKYFFPNQIRTVREGIGWIFKN